MKRKLSNLIFMFLLITSILVCISCNKNEEPKNTEPEKTDTLTQVIPVRVMKLAPEKVSGIAEASGIVFSEKDVTVMSQTAGTVIADYMVLGKRVAKGAVLVQVDPEPFQIALDIANAAFSQAEIGFEQSKLEYERTKKLHDNGDITDAAFDAVKFAFKGAEAVKKGALASVAQAKRELRKTKIRAPFAGEIATKRTKLGATIAQGSPVADLVDSKDIKVKIGIGEDLIGALSVGFDAKVKIPTLGIESISAKITAIGFKAIQPTMTYPIELKFESIPKNLKIGMVTRVELEIGEKKDSLLVPLETPIERFDHFYVYTVKDGLATEQQVTLGMKIGKKVVLTDGVSAGDEVVITGQTNLQDGSNVRVVE